MTAGTPGAAAPAGGHGHVVPRPDGVKARCGGPALCSVCAKELAAQHPASGQEPGAAPPARRYRVGDRVCVTGVITGVSDSDADWVIVTAPHTTVFPVERASVNPDLAHAAPVSEQEPGAVTPKRDLRAEEVAREFTGWFVGEGYNSREHFNEDFVAEAFAAGMQAQADLAAAAPAAYVAELRSALAQAAGLADSWRENSAFRATDTHDEIVEHAAIRECADELDATLGEHPGAAPAAPASARADEFARVKVKLCQLIVSLDETTERAGSSDYGFDQGAGHASAVTARQLRQILDETALGAVPAAPQDAGERAVQARLERSLGNALADKIKLRALLAEARDELRNSNPELASRLSERGGLT